MSGASNASDRRERAASQERAEAELSIEAAGLTRRFGDHTALDGLDLRVGRGETFGLLGANGAGKTTFVRLVAGVLLPTRGTLRVEGLSPVRDPAPLGRRIGFAMETPRLYPELRVTGFLRFAGAARGLRGVALARAVTREIERFGLGDVARRLIGQLSKGTQQRVSLAQAFLHDPSLVVLDEPTSGLDPLQRDEVYALLARREAGRSVVLCTHDLAEARALCTHVGVLHAGRLIAVGSPSELFGTGDPLAHFRAPRAETIP